MSVSGIGASSYLIDYWELLRRGEAKGNTQTEASVLEAIAPVGEETESTQQTVVATQAPAPPPEHQNLFAEQLAATILEEDLQEEETDRTPVTVPQTPAAAIGGAIGSSSDSSSNKITVKSITENGERYIVGVRTDENGEEVEVYRIPQKASARKLPSEDIDEFSKLKLLINSDKDIIKSAQSALLTREAHIAYGMTTPSASSYGTAA